MPFGLHKGKPLSQVPPDYLRWLKRRGGIDAELHDAVRIQLEGRDLADAHLTPNQPTYA